MIVDLSCAYVADIYHFLKSKALYKIWYMALAVQRPVRMTSTAILIIPLRLMPPDFFKGNMKSNGRVCPD